MKRDKFEKVLALARKSEGNEQKLAWTRVVEAYRKADPMAQANLDDLIEYGEWASILSDEYADDIYTASGADPDCRSCSFVDLENDLCRRQPPSALVAREEVQQGLPNIFPGVDWCWEWVERRER